MIDFEMRDRISQGSNSYVYDCVYKDISCIVKIPKIKERYPSFNMQVKALQAILVHKSDINFLVPQIFFYDKDNSVYGEVLIMEKMENIFPIDFLIRQQLVDYQQIVSVIAKAVAFLHSISISGYDVEFYWNIKKHKLVLLDIGQQYTIGISTEEMLKKSLFDEKDNIAGLWNIIACIMKKQDAIKIYELGLISTVTYKQLIQEIKHNSVQLHIENVAKSHYIQIIACLNKCVRSDATKLFVKIYKKNIKKIDFQTMAYINSFEKANNDKIDSCTVKLYYSKNDTVSNMSNSNRVKDLF